MPYVADPTQVSMANFPVRGMNLDGLTAFVKHCGGNRAFVHQDGTPMTTFDVVQAYIRPLTEASKSSYCTHAHSNSQDGVGAAEVFISHAWSYNFIDLIEAVLHYFASAPKKFLWIDVFSVNQHIQTNHDFQWWSLTFKDAIKNFGQVVMVISPWENPKPFTRAWCLFEIYAATVTRASFDVAMTVPQEKKFTTAILEDIGSYFDMLAKIDLRDSHASFENDKKQIFNVVERSCGFQKLNILICEYMRNWVLTVVERNLSSSTTLEKKHQMLLTKSKILVKQDKPRDAEEILTEAFLDECMHTYGVDSAQVAEIHITLSKVFDCLRNYEKCINEALEAIRIYDKHRSSHGTELADCHCHLSFMYILHGCFSDVDDEEYDDAHAKSLMHATKALNMKTQMYGPEDRRLSQTLNNYGNALYRVGRIFDAMSSFDRQLEILTKHNMLEHPDAASCFYMKGMMYSSMCQKSSGKDVDLGTKAAQWYERCIALRIRKLGFDHHSVAAAYRNLADVFCNCCDDLESAILACKKSLDSVLKSSLGPKSQHLPEAVEHLIHMICKCAGAELRRSNLGAASSLIQQARNVSSKYNMGHAIINGMDAQITMLKKKLEKRKYLLYISTSFLALSHAAQCLRPILD